MSDPRTVPLIDQSARTRFTTELDANFSVVAPAGVGKTRAITERILALAHEDRGKKVSRLPKLVVVTYTRKAAQELRQRAQAALVESGLPVGELARLEEAYFGTIHSLCLRLVRQYGYLIGVPHATDIESRIGALWQQFIRSQDDSVPTNDAAAKQLLKLVNVSDVHKVAEEFAISGMPTVAPQPPLAHAPVSASALQALYDFKPGKRSEKTVARDKEQVRRWVAKLESDDPDAFAELPSRKCNAKDYTPVWDIVFQPINDWIGSALHYYGYQLAKRFQSYRLEQGKLSFVDQIETAARLVRLPYVQQALCARDCHVILDEAQDTDPQQFAVLLALASQQAPASDKQEPPLPGRFCMVGDPQQSIYGDRADLVTYQRVRQLIAQSEGGAELAFRVTFRCSEAVVNACNTFVPALFERESTRDYAVDYVPLQAKPDAKHGQVCRIELPAITLGEANKKPGSQERLQHAARCFVDWLKGSSLEQLHARSWDQVAILLPRNTWFPPLKAYLEAAGFLVQQQSQKRTLRYLPAYSWPTALLKIMHDPLNGFEIMGVLRELFALPDSQIAIYCGAGKQGGPVRGRLQIMESPFSSLKEMAAPEADDPVANALELLHELCVKVNNMPLRELVQTVFTDIKLEQRLLALPDINATEQREQLERMLLAATVAEEQRLDLGEFVTQLVDGLDGNMPEQQPAANHLQLLSCHKAKGLEWDAVLVPFIERAVSFPDLRYPYVKTDSATRQIIVAANSSHDLAGFKEALASSREAELDRLVYVTATRARNTLVFLHEAEFGAGGKLSFSELMQVDSANADWWKSLDDKLSLQGQNDSKPDVAKDNDSAIPVINEKTDRSIDYGCGLNNARKAKKRLLPSSLADHGRHLATETKESALSSDFSVEEAKRAGADYGNWWHGLMEDLPWLEDAEQWEAAYQQSLANSNNLERSQREWQAFLKSDVQSTIQGYRVRAEQYMLWQQDGETVFEGIIDWVGFSENPKLPLLVIDWKTDQLRESEPIEVLADRYRPQVSVYTRALESIYKRVVRTALYSTYRGELVWL